MAAVNLTPSAGAATQALVTLYAPAKVFFTASAAAATAALASPSTPVTGNGLPQSIDPLAIFSDVNTPDLEPPDLLSEVPPFEQNSYEIQAVLGVVANELARIEAAQQALVNNFFPASADALLPIFESLLGLPVAPPGLDIGTRQQIVLAYMQRLKSGGRGLDWINALSALAGVSFTYQEHLTNPITNLCTNGSFEQDVVGALPAGWNTAPGYWINTGATVTKQTTGGGYVGASAMRIVTPGVTTLTGAKFPINVTAGQPMTVSAAFKGAAGGEQIQLGIGDAVVGWASTAAVTLSTGWQVLTTTLTPTASGSTFVGIRQNQASYPAVTFYVDAVMLVNGSSAPAYADGDSLGYQWSGAAGNSTSFQSSPPANTVLVKIPSALAGVGWPYIRDITPAHIAIQQGYTDGFFVGITNIGSNL